MDEKLHNEIKNSLRGTSHAANKRHIDARGALMDLLLTDPRTTKRFEQWTTWSGLLEYANNTRTILVEIADTLGISPEDFWVKTPPIDRIKAEQNSRFQLALRALVNAVDDPSRIQAISRDAMHFVRVDLDLAWPWLCIELTEAWMLNLIGHAIFYTYTSHREYTAQDPIAPNLHLDFTNKPGETIGQALQRLRSATEAIEQELLQAREQTSLPAGRQSNPETIKRYVKWFYRNELCREGIRRIAKTDNYERSTIRRGIDEARQALDATVWGFDPHGENNK